MTDTQSGPAFTTGSSTGGSGPYGTPAGSATSSCTYGSINLRGQASVALTTQARGEFRDTLVFTAPGVPNNSVASVTFSVRVSGALGASSGTSAGSWNLGVDLGGAAFDISRTATFYSPIFSNAGYNGAAFGVYSATVNLLIGLPVPLIGMFSGVAQANVHASDGAGNASFGGPLRMDWLGISNVTINGQPVANVSVSSLSGTNWMIDLTPASCDSIDFNNNGVFPEDQDVIDFFTVLAGGTPASCDGTLGCNDIDFNNNGVFPEDQDVIDFFNVLAGGSCS
ncbi:MAG TPA: hypothetical protein VK157_00460 [Phycisphaerales bacterium]|nr:hypothetical protein [Phycisphaerales bacterium]